MNELTQAQQATLDFIKEYQRKNGIPPTQSEISQGMGWSSANNAHLKLAALQKKGYLTVRRGTSRGIMLHEKPSVSIPDVDDVEYWFEGVFQHRRYERDVYKEIEAVGLSGTKKRRVDPEVGK